MIPEDINDGDKIASIAFWSFLGFLFLLLLSFVIVVLNSESIEQKQYIEQGRERARQEFYDKVGYEQKMNELQQLEKEP